MAWRAVLLAHLVVVALMLHGMQALAWRHLQQSLREIELLQRVRLIENPPVAA